LPKSGVPPLDRLISLYLLAPNALRALEQRKQLLSADGVGERIFQSLTHLVALKEVREVRRRLPVLDGQRCVNSLGKPVERHVASDVTGFHVGCGGRCVIGQFAGPLDAAE